jgi:deoxyribose-phosphate aldolase
MTDLRVVAARALPLLDLTNLDADCDGAAVDALCACATTPHGRVAALCIWPHWVARAQARLAGTGIRVTTVANFPAGEGEAGAAAEETARAFAAGADEVDVVLPWRAVLAAAPAAAAALVRRCRQATPPDRILKVILETGALQSAEAIATAARIALDEGAHFLKTSTGKCKVNATPTAAELLLAAIRDSGRAAGFKAAGGIRTTEDAARYLAIADRILGREWAAAATFRFGASGLLADLVRTLEGEPARHAASSGY